MILWFISVYSQLQICYNRNTRLRHGTWWERDKFINHSKYMKVSGWKLIKAAHENFTTFTKKPCVGVFFMRLLQSSLLKRDCKNLKHPGFYTTYSFENLFSEPWYKNDLKNGESQKNTFYNSHQKQPPEVFYVKRCC